MYEQPSTETSLEKISAGSEIRSQDLHPFFTLVLEPSPSEFLTSGSEGPQLVADTLEDLAALASRLVWQQSELYIASEVSCQLLALQAHTTGHTKDYNL